MPLFELLIDIFLAVLLTATLCYCYMLNRRVRLLQDSRGELARLLSHFDESTRRASDSIAVLQSTGKKIGESIQERVDRANFLIDDLNFLLDRAEKAADRLEAGIHVGRTARKVQQEIDPPPPAPKPAPAEAMNQVRAAVKALAEEEQEPLPVTKNSAMASLQAMIEKIASKNVSDPALRGQRAAKFPETRARSRVEQELLEIIRAGKG